MWLTTQRLFIAAGSETFPRNASSPVTETPETRFAQIQTFDADFGPGNLHALGRHELWSRLG